MGSRTNVDFNEIGIQIWYKRGDQPVICHPERSEGMTILKRLRLTRKTSYSPGIAPSISSFRVLPRSMGYLKCIVPCGVVTRLIQVPVRRQRQKLDKLLLGNNAVEQLSSLVKLTRGILLLSNHTLDLIQFIG